ncbi:unnamed protein product [Meloidogyne enterolobii]|uniref:Uncharacterized protein n=1 Tax=Meloidogyne enterolobii TaxID=390850 RepID=A0ACB0YF28_MELEN
MSQKYGVVLNTTRAIRTNKISNLLKIWKDFLFPFIHTYGSNIFFFFFFLYCIFLKIINQLSIESRLFIKQTNDQKISSLSEKIQSSINLLQNPTDCFTAKIFVCPVSKLGNLYKNIFFLFRRKKAVLVGDLVFCCIGFGKFLIFNFIKLLFNSFCFIFAFKSGRTVVFTNETIRVVNNQYDVKWNELFKTASKCSYTEHVKCKNSSKLL